MSGENLFVLSSLERQHIFMATETKNVFVLGRKNSDGSMMTGDCQYERSYRIEPQQKVYGEKLFDLLSDSREHILTETEFGKEEHADRRM